MLYYEGNRMPQFDAFSWNLILATAAIAITHTLFGPDHYLPFIMLARARRWSNTRTVLVTMSCGFGHILSSLLLGSIGLAAGSALSRIERLEGMRGDWAAWGLFAFGFAYLVWGVRRAITSRRGITAHAHGIGVHIHSHGDHLHGHTDAAPAGSTPPASSDRSRVTFWGLFIIFVLGPCEPLIPLFVLPASRGRWDLAVATGILFAVITITLMVAVTLLALKGLTLVNFGRMEQWTHAMAGAVIMLSGAAILFLGL
jgi:nickel/cobalt transporter (NicO) family protein